MNGRLPAPATLPERTERALAELVADAKGAFGPRSLAWLCARHLALFAELRALPATWAQIAGLLNQRGIAGPAGPITEATLRATLSRATSEASHERAPLPAPDDTFRTAVKHGEAKRNSAKRNEAERPASTSGASQHDAAPPNAASRIVTIDRRSGRRRSPLDANNLARRAALIGKPWNSR